MEREWAMPSVWTFDVAPISALLKQEMIGLEWADPFAGYRSPARWTNDIEVDRPTAFHLDALEFLSSLATESLDGVLFDPPYSVEQCLRRYTPKFGGTAGRAEYWARCKREIRRIVRLDGKVVCFGWDSTGVGNEGYELERVLLVCHGACHNDTIVTVERRVMSQGSLL